MLESMAQVCITMHRLYKQIQHFCRTGVPKLSPGYCPGKALTHYITLPKDKYTYCPSEVL